MRETPDDRGGLPEAVLDSAEELWRAGGPMDPFTLLCELAERAGVSPASMLYTFVEDTLANAAEDPEFQSDWVEVAEETGDRAEAVAFFKKLQG